MRQGLSQRGSVIPLVVATLSMTLITFFSLQRLHRMQVKRSSKGWKVLVAREAVRSSFILMEAALKRRLWEVPPETRSGPTPCLKRKDFSLEGETPEGVEYELEAEYDPVTSIIVMNATGTYGDLVVHFKKESKILDVSDFLMVSKDPSPDRIVATYETSVPTTLIANQSKLYFEGPVEFYIVRTRSKENANIRNNATSFTTPVPADLPNEIGVIIQAERLIFRGGISGYVSGPADRPDFAAGSSDQAKIYDALTNPDDLTNSNNWWHYGGGGAYITNDYDKAMELVEWGTAGIPRGPTSLPPGPSLLGRAEIYKNIYPRVLFGKGQDAPLYAPDAVDDGNFLGNPDEWIIWSYSRLSGAGTTRDFTCYTDKPPAVPDPDNPSIFCSSSASFPNGYLAWKAEAGLDTAVMGNEAPSLDMPTIDWDNYEALEEDATACGVVVTSSSGNDGRVYDCDIYNPAILDAYLANPTINPCRGVYSVDFESLSAKITVNDDEFSRLIYENNSNKADFLRRVIYAKVPIQISQSGAQGLWVAGANDDGRSNLPLWIVTEQDVTIQPNQPDQTSPLEERPGEMREMYFNQDVSGGTLKPLPLTILTPEKVTIISAFHVPHTYQDLLDYFPVVDDGGDNKIKPRYHLVTDFRHQEEDGFKYGYRRINLNHMAIISGTNVTSFRNSFYLKGLFSVANDSDTQYLQNACFFDKPGDGLARTVGDDIATLGVLRDERIIPEYINETGEDEGWIPPVDSRYYGDPSVLPVSDGDKMDNYIYTPRVFGVQGAAGVGRSSIINLTGWHIIADFDNSTPDDMSTGTPGPPLRNLAVAAVERDGRIHPSNPGIPSKVFMGDRRIFMDPEAANPTFFFRVPSLGNGKPCSEGFQRRWAPLSSPTPPYIGNRTLPLNTQMSSSEQTIQGSMMAIELPVVEVGN